MRRLAVLAAFASLATAAPAFAGPSGLHVAARIPGPDGGWDYASFDPARQKVYIAHTDTVLAIDARTGKLDAHFATGDHLHAIVPVPGTDLIVTTNSGDDSAKIISAATGHLIASVPTAKDADGAVFDPSSGDVLVVNGDPGLITRVDPKTAKADGVITVGTGLEFPAVDGHGHAWVNEVDANKVAAIDLAANKVSAQYPLTECDHPTGLAYVSGARLVVACGGGGAVILDAGSGRQIAHFDTGRFPDAVIYDPNRQLAMVPSAFAGELTVIALSGPKNNQVIDTVPTQIGARTGAVDPKTGRVWLPTATYKLPIPQGQRPTPEPGTFVVLMLDR
ncbi:MAG TPA: hypothetical protein VGS12_08080 [Caulobacteraceae bacterium]|nr:hypothetical protein [Caulobacteraceae bacterium]